MTDQVAAEQELFNAMATKHGGADRLSALDVEIITICARTMVAMRAADPSEASRMAATVAQLTSTLPTPPADDAAEQMDLTKLTDAELAELERLQCKALDRAAPSWSPDDDAPSAPPMGPAQLEGNRLGAWIDANSANWTHRQLLSTEQLELRNGFQFMSRGFIARNLWADIYRADMQTEIERAVASALRSVGSDATITKLTPEERAQLSAPPALLPDPPEPPASDGGPCPFPPFSFGGNP